MINVNRDEWRSARTDVLPRGLSVKRGAQSTAESARTRKGK
jgi:hypothetical protein